MTELSIMKKLLMPASKVLGMDATDFASWDAWLKEDDKNVRVKATLPVFPPIIE